ncbi:Sulfurtransferase [Candidatus Sulfopaludibacter sp. SbA3]|nr:Sulfurtransferase [Candidatus Sulfopaludibacter sp. SbA3]
MKRFFVASVVCLSSLLHAAPGCGGHGTRDTMLVSTAWLAAHLNDANLVVLAVGRPGEYDSGHIPGALELKYSDIVTRPGETPLTTELPPMDRLADLFGKLGVSNESRVILYVSNDGLSLTTRAYLTLDAMGMGARTALLDGGFVTWKNENRPVTKEVRAVKAAKLAPCPQNDIIALRDYVQANLRHAGIDIVDARDASYYTGAQVPNNRRAGHIPGATNIAYTTLVDAMNKFKPAADLAALFAAGGVKPGDRVVSYCHIGQQATVVYFAARYLGYDARLYDGSWEDWSAHTELPAEVSTGR